MNGPQPAPPDVPLGIAPKTRYRVECRDRAGNLKWVEEFDNLVTTAGKNKLIDACFKTGLTSPAWFVGLKGTGSVAAGDTMASHAGWSEFTAVSNGTRPAWTPGSVSGGSVDNSASKAVFTINADNQTVYGAFLADNATLGGATGTLYGGGDLGTARSGLMTGDTLSITVTPSVS